MYMRGTCHQRSNSWGKRKALAFYFFVRTWYVFLISKFQLRSIRNFGTCNKQFVCAVVTSDYKTRSAARFVASCHHAAALFLQVSKLCTNLDQTLLYILIYGTYSKFVWTKKMPAPGICFPQSSSSAGRIFASWRSCLDHVIPTNCFFSTRTRSTKCLVNWFLLRIRVHSKNTQPYLKVRLGISRMNADSQWNVVETKRFVGRSVSVIFTLQTCGQRLSRVAESKRWALENHFPEWIFYTFLMSKCKGGWDLDQCTFWVLAKRELLCNDNLRKKMCFDRRKNRNFSLCSVCLFTSTQKVHWSRSQTPLRFDIRNV